VEAVSQLPTPWPVVVGALWMWLPHDNRLKRFYLHRRQGSIAKAKTIAKAKANATTIYILVLVVRSDPKGSCQLGLVALRAIKLPTTLKLCNYGYEKLPGNYMRDLTNHSQRDSSRNKDRVRDEDQVQDTDRVVQRPATASK